MKTSRRNGLSRRNVIKGAIAIAGVASLQGAAPVGAQPAAATRRDIVSFAQKASRLAKFEAAVKEMKARSRTNANDPKGWLVHAKAHADFCSLPNTAANQIHFCWWFLPWHRAYITVTERKIREISGDPTFAYPYWNWTSDRRIPQAYRSAGSPLADAVRFTPNRPVDDGEVDFFPNNPTLKQLGVAALAVTAYEATTPGRINRTLGGIARPNPANSFGNNRLEGTPHGPIHNYAGGFRTQDEGGDMTDFETAARDPIFFAHHGNLDRLWEIWRKDPARRATEPTSDAFLKHRFPFPWLDGTVMQIAVEETLDTLKLGFVYDNMQVTRPGTQAVVVAQAAQDRLPAVGSGSVRNPLTPQAAGDERKILEITEVEPPPRPMTVGVYVKPANAPADDPGVHVGTFAAVKAGGVIAWPSRTLSFDITDVANRFAGQELTVNLVPYRIRAQGAEEYPPLRYEAMRIVTER